MKTRSLIITFVLLIGIGKVKAQTVYVTDTGKKYHTRNCSLLKDGTKKSISLAEAKRQGYEACRPCKADEIVPEDKKKKSEPAK